MRRVRFFLIALLIGIVTTGTAGCGDDDHDGRGAVGAVSVRQVNGSRVPDHGLEDAAGAQILHLRFTVVDTDGEQMAEQFGEIGWTCSFL